MTARSHIRGHQVRYIGGEWIDCETGFVVGDKPCCNCGRTPGDAGIDPCLETLIVALNAVNIKTVASCCGHGRRPGNIVLADGRELIIARDYKTARLVDEVLR